MASKRHGHGWLIERIPSSESGATKPAKLLNELGGFSLSLNSNPRQEINDCRHDVCQIRVTDFECECLVV